MTGIKKLKQSYKTSLQDIYQHTVEVGDCLEWARGYGSGGPQTSYMGRQGMSTRRVVAMIMGLDVTNKCVTNSCGNLKCVNAEHIRVCSKKQMMLRLSKSNRLYSPTRGIKVSAIKTTIDHDTALQIILSDKSQVQLAKEHGISQNAISKLKNKRGFRGPASVFTWMP